MVIKLHYQRFFEPDSLFPHWDLSKNPITDDLRFLVNSGKIAWGSAALKLPPQFKPTSPLRLVPQPPPLRPMPLHPLAATLLVLMGAHEVYSNWRDSKTPAIDKPPEGKDVVQWIDDMEKFGLIAAEITILQQQIRLMDEWGLGIWNYESKERLELLFAQAQTIAHDAGMPITSGALKMVASATATSNASEALDVTTIGPDSDQPQLIAQLNARLKAMWAEVAARVERNESPLAIQEWARATICSEFLAIQEALFRISGDEQWHTFRHDFIHRASPLYHILNDVAKPHRMAQLRLMLTDTDPYSFYVTFRNLGAALGDRIKLGSEFHFQYRLAPGVDTDAFWRIVENVLGNAADHPLAGLDQTEVALYVSDNTLTFQIFGKPFPVEDYTNIHNRIRTHGGVAITAANDIDENKGRGFGWQSIIENCEKMGIIWAINAPSNLGPTITFTLPEGMLVSEPSFAQPTPPVETPTPIDWEALAATKDSEIFFQAASLRFAEVRTEVLAHLDAIDLGSENCEGVLRWLTTDVFPELQRIYKLFDASMVVGRDKSRAAQRYHNFTHSINDLDRSGPIFLRRGQPASLRALLTPSLVNYNLLKEFLIAKFGNTLFILLIIPNNIHIPNAEHEALLAGVIENLARNAFNNPRPGQSLTYTTLTINPDQIVFKDEGAGMTPKTLAAVRNRQRISEGHLIATDDTSTLRGRGWEFVWNVCDTLGIKPVIDSTPGKGTTITLPLPKGIIVPDVKANTQNLRSD